MTDSTQAIAKLRALEENMTPVSWLAYRGANGVIMMLPPGIERWDSMSDNPNNDDDNRGLVAMRNAFPALLDIAEAADGIFDSPFPLDGQVDKLRAALAALNEVVE
ncbi:MAG: hypothetical protein KGL39_57865 [Patescibacteria group bacterium]|nr:hypothetical protein [Patescibacteria group bacterium]